MNSDIFPHIVPSSLNNLGNVLSSLAVPGSGASTWSRMSSKRNKCREVDCPSLSEHVCKPPGTLGHNLSAVDCFTISYPVMNAVLRSSIGIGFMVATIRFRMADSILMSERSGELAGQSSRISQFPSSYLMTCAAVCAGAQSY
jgi:hypothetical protein